MSDFVTLNLITLGGTPGEPGSSQTWRCPPDRGFMTMKSQSSTEGRPGIDDDELLACLLILTRSHGEAASADARCLRGCRSSRATHARSLRACGSSGRAGQSHGATTAACAQGRPVSGRAAAASNRACLLVGRSADGLSVQLVHPELGEAPVSLPVEHVESSYSGRAIYARPRLRFDARTPRSAPVGTGTGSGA